jgi:hypothetical protein
LLRSKYHGIMSGMSTTLTIQVSPCGASLDLEHNLLSPDTWTDTNNSNMLIVGSGFVDSSDSTKLICQSGPPDKFPVVTLLGANWNSQTNDTGDATCDLCQNTPNPQTWLVTARN